MFRGLSVGAFLVAVLVGTGAEACSGCGCRGGPGYRGPDGRCVGWDAVGRVCGSPPTTACRAEGPNAPAERAANEQVADRTRRGLLSPGAARPAAAP